MCEQSSYLSTCQSAIAALASCVLFGCPPPPPGQPSSTQQIAGAIGTTIPITPPSSVFLPGPGTNKWLALQVPSATSPTIRGLPSGLTPPAIVELRGWLTEADATCNGADPDWHFGLVPDPAWFDSLGINLNQVVTAGNINVFTASSSGRVLGAPQPLFHTNSVIAGWPTIHVELNGVSSGPNPPTTTFNGPLRPSSDWGFGGADPANCPNTIWPFNPPNPLAWQPALKPNQYVRMVGSLVTDEPHAETAAIDTWFINNLGINFLGSAAATTALQKNWETVFDRMDPRNPARWVEMHPPDVISVLNDVDAAGNATKQPIENLTGVTLFSGGCLAACGTSDLNIGLSPPGPAQPGGVQVIECIGSETNFGEIVKGTKDASGKFTGALITIGPTGATVSVSVQGEPGFGAPGKFKAIYRVGWKGQAPATAPPGCTLH